MQIHADKIKIGDIVEGERVIKVIRDYVLDEDFVEAEVILIETEDDFYQFDVWESVTVVR